MKKILIIEDDQLVANIYRNKLAQENLQVEIALDGEKGFEIINTFQPDIIILDLMLPTISGLELLKKIRAQENLKQLPIIVFSNTYLSNMVQEAWKAGATRCLSKANCTPREVIDVIRNLSQSAVEIVAPKPADADAAFQAELYHSFLATSPASVAACRAHLQSAAKAVGEELRAKYLHELHRRIHVLTANAGVAGAVQIAQMSDALEALLREICDKPKNINASTMRTVALAVDFIALLFERATPKESSVPPSGKPNILVVDDEAISRRAVTYALEKAKLPSTSVESPEVALNMLAENVYDLVFLDVDMPGMNGFELCTKLRGLHRNKSTPVVFVTSLNDFESRANSTMSGGNDLIAKPFLFMELAVKALVYVLRNRLPPPNPVAA